jgi:hypothetical protein
VSGAASKPTPLLLLGAREAHRLRSDDLHETPPQAVEALLAKEQFAGPVWEPACGRGAISRVLESHGHTVISTDLVERGYGEGRVDFLLEFAARAPNIITNSPYKLSCEFAEHATRLVPGKVAFLCRLAWLAGLRRRPLFEARLSRVLIFAKRLPMMHRDGWDGPRSTSAIDFAWFIFDPTHTGPISLGYLP